MNSSNKLFWRLLLVLAVLIEYVSLVDAKCGGYSPAFPLPQLDPNSKIIQKAQRKIERALKKAVSKADQHTTSFSVAVTSSEELLFEIHHTAEDRDGNRPGAETIDGNSCYRIASCTKTFTVLALLQQQKEGKLNLDDPVNMYIEELNTPQDGTLPWKDITLRTLATQLTGIPRDIGQGDELTNLSHPEAHGLPALDPSDHHEYHCDSLTNYTKPCSRADLIDRLKSSLPIFAPKQQSTYSNLNYEILALVLANVTSTPYESLIERDILQPLNLTSTTFTRPPDSVAALPKGKSYYWDVDCGIQNPTGGLYSSTNDLTSWIRYALTHYNGLTPAANWFAPVSYSMGLGNFYGMPWEIFRTDQLLSYTSRPVTFVMKAGGFPGYYSFIGSVPDYNFGFAILVAGLDSAVTETALDVVGAHMVHAADAIAHHTLAVKYAGTWTDTAAKNSSITLAQSRTHGGLYVQSWVSNGVDMLTQLGVVAFPFVPGTKSNASRYLQLVPTLLFIDEENQQGEVWRMIGQTLIDKTDEEEEEEEDEDGAGAVGIGVIKRDHCQTDIDISTYAGLPVNEVIFWDKDPKDGTFGVLELTGFRIKLGREDKKEKLVVQT